MSRGSKALLKLAGTVVVGSAAVVGLSVQVVAAAVIVALAVIVVVCWTITDSRRSVRLALLISATRGELRQPEAAASPVAGRPDARRGLSPVGYTLIDDRDSMDGGDRRSCVVARLGEPKDRQVRIVL